MIALFHKEECCGCTACTAVCPRQCIRMETDEEGFLYPITDQDRCIDCGLCESVCPCLHQGLSKEPIHCYASVHRTEEIRLASSSGGLFTALAEATLQNGGVVFGARFDNEFRVVHAYTETLEGLAAFRGSKYVQSDIRNSFKQAEQFLKEGREVLFSGVPCQISGFKAFLRREYKKLITLDILCHGVASPAVWTSFIQPYITPQKPEQITFRDKQNGWKQYECCLKFPEKEIRLNRETNPYMTGYFANLYLRPACHECPRKGFSTDSDLTLGDCWGIEKQASQPYYTDNKGVSLVMVHTLRGAERMQQIRASIQCTPINYRPMERYNPAIRKCPAPHPQRAQFFTRWRQQEAFEQIIASLTHPTWTKKLETLCTPLLNALGIKGFTKRLRK